MSLHSERIKREEEKNVKPNWKLRMKVIVIALAALGGLGLLGIGALLIAQGVF